MARCRRTNAEAFQRAVDAVAAVSMRLLNELVTAAPPKDRSRQGPENIELICDQPYSSRAQQQSCPGPSDQLCC
ncbi:MAG: DUF2277 family protein [Pseudonocardiaceae bacterium]